MLVEGPEPPVGGDIFVIACIDVCGAGPRPTLTTAAGVDDAVEDGA